MARLLDASRTQCRELLSVAQIGRWNQITGKPSVKFWTTGICEAALADPGCEDGWNGNGSPAVTPETPEPASEPVSSDGNGQPANGGDMVNAMQAFIEQAAGKSMDEDRVKAIANEIASERGEAVHDLVSDMLDKLEAQLVDGLAKFKPAKPDRFEVKVGDAELREIKGHKHAQFERLLKLATAKRRTGQRFNVLVVGPTGCGKSWVAAQVAEALDLRYGHINLSGGTSEAALIGRFVPTGEGGRFEYVMAQFTEFYLNGGLFVLEEIDAADPNALLTVNNALANGHMATPNPDQPVIKRHPDFVCFACANTWGLGANRMYVGRNQLDAATIDRFATATVEVNYDIDLEDQLGREDVVTWAHGLRRKIDTLSLRRVISTRTIVDASDLLDQDAASWDEIRMSVLGSWSGDELAKVGESLPG